MPPVAIVAVAAGVAIAGGIAGAIERSNASADAKQKMKERLAELEKAGMPPNTALPLVLQEFKQQGFLTPQMEKEINIEASKVAQIKEDPKLRQAAVEGLQLLQQRSEQGFGPEEQAAFNQARNLTAKETTGRLQSILQQSQARGQSGGGQELAAQLSASQAGDEQLSNEGINIAAEKARASRDAIQKMFGAASELRNQDFNVAKTKATAEDELNRFRVSTEADRQARNIAAQNRAEEKNLSEKQRIADANINMHNMEQARENEARMRDYLARMDLARAKGGIYSDQAQQRIAEGNAAAKGWNDMGQGVSGAVTGAGAYGMGKQVAAVPTQPGQVSSVNPQEIQGLDQSADNALNRNVALNNPLLEQDSYANTTKRKLPPRPW